MKLTFPFKNITINTLWDFFKEERVKEFSNIETNKDPWWNKEHFDGSIQRWKNNLPNFENEILQVINTTDQATINAYFIELQCNLTEVEECLTKEYFMSEIASWNERRLKEYSKEVEKEGDIYAKGKNRKMAHLEEYEDWIHTDPFFLITPKKVKKVNYNFYCIEKVPDLIEEKIIDEYLTIVQALCKDLFALANKYLILFEQGKIVSNSDRIPKPIVFVEGDIDVDLIKAAAKHLKRITLLQKIELRQRGGYRNLDKLWNILKEGSWETVSQIKIFLYDCDTNREDEDFGNHYRRKIPKDKNSLINKGIENLFPEDLIQRALKACDRFIDMKKTIGRERGKMYILTEYSVNKEEKRNFCDWVCSNGKADDFRGFEVVFRIIEDLV